MDIEEGEIIISDLSSDEKDCQTQQEPWNKDKTRAQSDNTCRYQNTSKSRPTTFSSSSRFKGQGQHYCNENSFCRTTFSWHNCLANDSSGRKAKSTTKSFRDDTLSEDSSLRKPNKKNTSRLKCNDYMDYSHIHGNHRSKKRKRKGKSANPAKKKPEKDRYLHHIIEHCENPVTNVCQMIQPSNTPISTVVTHENTSLMQKLITSGLAKPPATSNTPLEIILSSSESETFFKKEKTPTDDNENKDYSDDSEIEVIIPPKKIPPLVTLDSDGEETEQLGLTSFENPNTLDDHQDPTLSDITNNVSNDPTLRQIKATMNTYDCIEVSNNNSHINKLSEVADSSDSVCSEVCGSLPYTPSSPSSVSGSENNTSQNQDLQSLVCNGNNTNNLQSEDNFCRDYSSASNEEISSEIWLDQNEQQTSGNLENSHLIGEHSINQEESVHEECANSLKNGNSLSALAENLIINPTSIAKKRNIHRKIDEFSGYKPVDLEGDSNGTTLQNNENSDDQEPYSPSSEYNCDTLGSNSLLPPNQRPDAGNSTTDTIIPIDNVTYTQTMFPDSNLELKINTAVLKILNENIDQSNPKSSEDSNLNKNTNENDDDDNVSQLRMIALRTKRKVNQVDTQSECTDQSIIQLPSDRNADKVAEPDSKEGDDDDVLQLRVAALKSAVIKKYGERKKRGLLLKKRKIAPAFGDDIFTSPKNNSAVEQENVSPLSPTKSSTSVQGEEDMELAESDFGEDVIEEIDTSSVIEKSKLIDPGYLGSFNQSDPSLKHHKTLQPPTTQTHSLNSSIIVPPQPLPPGVDGDCPEIINQTIFTTVLPPPPPPPSLTFTPMLPPPPPPPLPTPDSSSTQSIQPPLLLNNNNNSEVLRSNLDKLTFQENVLITSSCTLKNPTFEKELEVEDSVIESSYNNQLASDNPKKNDAMKTNLRGNLITVPVIKDVLKPVLTKNPMRKRRKKKNKSPKLIPEHELNVLCITKPAGKSSAIFGGNGNLVKTNPEMISPNYDTNPPVLCKTNIPSDNWRDDDYKNDIWQNQQLSGLDSTSFNLSEELNIADDDIDISDMIVIDEVGMSPEHKSNKNESNLDYSSPYEEYEDEDTLRIKALTSLSPKPLFKKTTSPQHVYSHIEQSYCNNQEISSRGQREYDQRNVFERPTEKSNQIRKRKVVGIDTSKYRLTRVSNEQRRSVVHGKETLKVVVPTNSPPHSTLEPSLPVVQRLVINVNKDSDSEEECEWTRKIRIHERKPISPGPVVDIELERSIDELLMRARYSTDYDSTPKQNQYGSSTINPERRITEDDSLNDTPLKLLSKEKQEEYKRLKAILDRKEKERQLKKMPRKGTEKSKPLLQHVLINENNKQNQKNSDQDCSISNEQREGNQNLEERIVEDDSSVKVRNVGDKDVSPSPVRGNDGQNDSYDQDTEYCRRVIYHDHPVQPIASKGSHKNVGDLQSKCTDQHMSINELNNDKKVNTDSKKQHKPHESSDLDVVGSRSKQHLSIVNTTINVNKEDSENLSNRQKELTAASVKYLQNNIDKNKKNISGYQLAMDNKNTPKLPADSQTNSKEGSNHLAPEDLHLESTPDTASKPNNLSVLNANDAGPKSEIQALCSTENHATTIEISNDIEADKEATVSSDCQVSSNDNNRLPKTNTGYSDKANCSDKNYQTQTTDISNPIKNVETEIVEKLKPHNTLNDLHQLHTKQCSPEELGGKKSELLSERFGLLDDLSEMAESLDDLDSQQRKLEQAVVEISDLRKALRAAESSLYQQISVVNSLEHRFHETQSAVSVRRTNIAHLEKTLHDASYEIPTTAQKLMSKKIRQVKDKMDKVKGGRSVIKSLINQQNAVVTEIHANLFEKISENLGQEDIKEISNSWLQDPNTFLLDDSPLNNKCADSDSQTDSINLNGTNDSNTLLDGQVLQHVKENQDNHKESVSSSVGDVNKLGLISLKHNSSKGTTCSQKFNAITSKSGLEKGDSMFDNSNLAVELPEHQATLKSMISPSSHQAEETFSKSREYQNEDPAIEYCAPKSVPEKWQNFIENDNVTDDEVKQCNTTRNITSDIACGNSNQKCNPNATKSKLKYKSVLQFRESGVSAKKSSSGETIICPYDLKGRCQDKLCKYQHFPR